MEALQSYAQASNPVAARPPTQLRPKDPKGILMGAELPATIVKLIQEYISVLLDDLDPAKEKKSC